MTATTMQAIDADQQSLSTESELADVKQAIDEANRGEFATPEEVTRFFAKYDCD